MLATMVPHVLATRTVIWLSACCLIASACHSEFPGALLPFKLSVLVYIHTYIYEVQTQWPLLRKNSEEFLNIVIHGITNVGLNINSFVANASTRLETYGSNPTWKDCEYNILCPQLSMSLFGGQTTQALSAWPEARGARRFQGQMRDTPISTGKL